MGGASDVLNTHDTRIRAEIPEQQTFIKLIVRFMRRDTPDDSIDIS